jgi:hypothetical protein
MMVIIKRLDMTIKAKKTNFLFNNVFFNKINQLYNIFYQNLFKSAEAT